MGIIRRTPASLKDYSEIWDYVSENGGDQAADGMLQKFDAKLDLISHFPKMGPARPELRPGLRFFPVGKYLLFYRPIRGGIELVRVLHSARDLRGQFRNR